jgi:hypothetical protein
MVSFLDSRLRELYANKPECVIDLPEWLLPSQKIDAYLGMTGLAIVEVAGRDSIAAAIKSVQDQGFTDLLPTYVYTGTEYGSWESVEGAVERLAARLPEVRIHDLVVLGSPDFWQALNGRFISELIARHGFFTPCVGCHLYLHSARVPLSITLGRVPIISGERQQHDGGIKVNQISQALDVYENMAKHFGVRLTFPLRHIGEGDKITEILGFEWQAGREQLGCVLSGNYRTLDRSKQIKGTQVKTYLEDFAGPCAKEILESYIQGHVPNHVQIAHGVLHGLSAKQERL